MVRQTGCGKTTSIQNLATNKMFGDIKEVYWLSREDKIREREDNVSKYFNKHVDFKYPKSIEDFILCLDFFQRKKKN